MPRPIRTLARSQPRLFALLLALALVSAQMLGLLHRIAHADRGATTVSSARHLTDAARPAASTHRAGGGLLALFAGHDQPHDCDAFDQMSHADLAVGHVLAFVLTSAPAEVADVHSAWHVAAQAQGFLARGPPVRS